MCDFLSLTQTPAVETCPTPHLQKARPRAEERHRPRAPPGGWGSLMLEAGGLTWEAHSSQPGAWRTRSPGYKGSGTGAHAHLIPSPKVQGHMQGTPGLAALCPWPWPCWRGLAVSCPSLCPLTWKVGPITLPCEEAPPHPGEAAVHACLHTHTHTCSAGVLRWCPLGIHSRPRLVPEQIAEQFVVMMKHMPLYLWARLSGFGAINTGAASAEWAPLLEDQNCPGRR